MTQDPGSLDRLHDLVLPEAVSGWPPAPGWYAVLGLGVGLLLWLAYRGWQRWQADAYRRAMVRELAEATDAAAIAELLRRGSLATAAREAVAGKTGHAWVDWLAAQSDQPISAEVRELLATGIYRGPAAPSEVTSLHNYAQGWITHRRAIDAGAEQAG